MNKLISLELKRNGLRSYHGTVVISTIVMLGLLYLMVLIPKIDPAEAHMAVFLDYNSLISMTDVICMAIFMILSAVMYARFVVEEYVGKKAILLFSYPVKRQSILKAKVGMVFSYTVLAMMLCGIVIFGIFFLTETIFHMCNDSLNIQTVLRCLFSLLCHSLLAGTWGIVALWFGFRRQSVQTTIVAAVIIAIVICQFASLSIGGGSLISTIIFLVIGIAAMIFAGADIQKKVQNMEV